MSGGVALPFARMARRTGLKPEVSPLLEHVDHEGTLCPVTMLDRYVDASISTTKVSICQYPNGDLYELLLAFYTSTRFFLTGLSALCFAPIHSIRSVSITFVSQEHFPLSTGAQVP